MIIDGYRFAKYLHDTGLKAEEFYLAYRIMVQEQNIVNNLFKLPGIKDSDDALQFSQWSKIYQDTHTPDNESWKSMCRRLQSKGFVEIWTREEDIIKLTDIKVTDLFKGYFFISESEHAVTEFLEIYPDWVIVNNSRYPARDKPIEELAKLYDKHITKGGSRVLHERCLLLTESYLKSLPTGNKSAPYKASNYIIEAFDGIASGIEKSGSYDDPFSEEA